MPEGISESPPTKTPGILQRVGKLVTEMFPEIDQIAKWRRSKKIRAKIRVLPQEQDLDPTTVQDEINTLPDLEQNIKASEQFIRQLRNPNRYSQDSHESQYLRSDLGFQVERGVGIEKGFFNVASIVQAAENKYRLPLAIYIDRSHARLVVKGPYQTPYSRRITVYDPMSSGFQEIDVNPAGQLLGVTGNSLAGEQMAVGQFDLKKFFEEPSLARYADLLTNIKAFNFQRDSYNCLPYCLFVGAMLNGLEPGATEFNQRGIKQFEQDFGVTILTRKDFLPKPRVRVIGNQG